jgi:DNA modification methylase
MHNLSIEQTPIRALKTRDRNARTHSKRQIRQIANSIERFGFTNPILTDDNLHVLAGSGRLEAAILLGMTTVPSIRLSHMSETDKRAYAIADNAIALKARWDRDTLAIELQELIDLGFEVELTGFETAEIDLMLNDLRLASDDDNAEDACPLPAPAPISKQGDLWLLGPHRIICGDAQDAETYHRLLESDRADLVFTDPPYNVPIDGHVSGLGQIRHREFAMASGEMTDEEFIAFLKRIFQRIAEVSRDGALHFICMDWRHVYETISAARDVYSSLLNLCVWNKDNGGMGSLYRSKHELVLLFKVGTASHTNNVELGRYGRNRTNVWEYAGANTFKAGRLDELAMHPTVKPVAMIADAIRDTSKRSHIVLDAFAGSGSTILAAEKTGRRARAVEIDPIYVDVAIRRWESYTGRQARLAGSNASFEEVTEQRVADHSHATAEEASENV